MRKIRRCFARVGSAVSAAAMTLLLTLAARAAPPTGTPPQESGAEVRRGAGSRENV